MGVVRHSWELLRASWQVLKLDKELLVFPLFSGIACLLVMASFAVPLFVVGEGSRFTGLISSNNTILQLSLVYLFYFSNYLVISFFNSAVVICATIRMNGGDPTVWDGLRLAWKRLPLIIRWAFFASGIGMLLRLLEARVGWIGKIVVSLLGFAWTVTSFLVIPVMVVDKRSPWAAFQESARLLKRTWGQQLITNFSFGVIFFLLAIPVYPLIILVLVSGSIVLMSFVISLVVVYIILLIIIQSALQGIVQAALFKYARSGQVAIGFEEPLLQYAILPKK